MKVSIDELRQIVGEVISEAKKKKEKAVELKREVKPEAYSYAEAFDFSAPLGGYNLYRSQGAVNWGPQTGAGPKIDDNVHMRPTEALSEESMLRSFMRNVIGEKLAPDESAWAPLTEAAEPRVYGSIWEAVMHWYDHQGFGLGGQTPAGIFEKKIGFRRLKGKLAHKKGVRDPGALAASIGRQKYGAAGMAKKAAAGRRK